MGFIVFVLIVLTIALVVAALMDRDAKMKRQTEATQRLRDALSRRGLEVSDADLARAVSKEISVDDLIARAVVKESQAPGRDADGAPKSAPDEATKRALSSLHDRVAKL